MAFKLDLPAKKVTGKIIRQHKKNFTETSAKRKWNTKQQLKDFSDFDDYEKFFGDILPYFDSIKIDEEGNIIVARFQVYSPAGEFVCESKVDFTGYLHPFIDRRFMRKIAFRKEGLYTMLEWESEDGEDSFKQLIKTKFGK